jgi:hypothetical protein
LRIVRVGHTIPTSADTLCVLHSTTTAGALEQSLVIIQPVGYDAALRRGAL